MMQGRPELRLLANPYEIAAEAARRFCTLARTTAETGDIFRVALSGGSTPKMLYGLLASDDYKDSVPWDSIQFFFGDERWVPLSHPDSNYKLANDELFTKVAVPPENIFPMPTEDLSPKQAAQLYETTLRRAFQEEGLPLFDLIFLGMGDDGHTASLFPHTDALREGRRLVAAPYVEKVKSHRITLTPPVLLAADRVLFMIAGESKAPALREVLQGEYNFEQYPSQLLRNALGQVTWLIDEAAASNLNSSR
jgi:6-phosphogluconolactonase